MLFQVIEVTPMHCVVQISKSAGELRLYNEVFQFIPFIFFFLVSNSKEWLYITLTIGTIMNQFCKSLSSLLNEKMDSISDS